MMCSYALLNGGGEKVLWDQFRENQGSLALKLDFQKPEDYISIVYYYISEI